MFIEEDDDDDEKGGDTGAMEWASGRRIYFIPQSIFKFHPSFDEAILGVLSEDVAACIVILADPDRSIYLHTLRQRWGGSDRIVVLDTLDRHSLLRFQKAAAAVALDTFPVGGGITSAELIGSGLCVVTLGKKISVIRTTEAMLKGAKRGGARATDVKEYVERAVEMGLEGKRCEGEDLFDVERGVLEVQELREFVRKVVV